MPAYLQVTLKVADENREAAAGVYTKYYEPFLNEISGAVSKSLLIRGEDVQVMNGFSSTEAAESYLTSEMFSEDIVGELGPLLDADPEIRIYEAH